MGWPGWDGRGGGRERGIEFVAVSGLVACFICCVPPSFHILCCITLVCVLFHPDCCHENAKQYIRYNGECKSVLGVIVELSIDVFMLVSRFVVVLWCSSFCLEDERTAGQ